MQLRNVEIFCEVAKRRSFSKAADALGVSQSSTSQAVHQLEKRLGVELIDRSIRPPGLTSAGVVFFEGCRKLVDGFRTVEDRVRQTENRVIGRVRVASIYSVGLLQMDAYAKRFRQLYPDAELQLSYLHPDDVYDHVQNERADLGIVSFPKDGGDVHSIAWQEQSMVLVTAPEHPLAKTDKVTPADLQGVDFVGLTPKLRIRRKIDGWLKAVKTSVNVVHEFDNIEIIKRAVEIGSGVSLLPGPTVQREADAGSLCLRQIVGTEWYRPLGIIHRRNKSMTAPVEKYVELLHEDPATFPPHDAARRSRNGKAAKKKRGSRKTILAGK